MPPRHSSRSSFYPQTLKRPVRFDAEYALSTRSHKPATTLEIGRFNHRLRLFLENQSADAHARIAAACGHWARVKMVTNEPFTEAEYRRMADVIRQMFGVNVEDTSLAAKTRTPTTPDKNLGTDDALQLLRRMICNTDDDDAAFAYLRDLVQQHNKGGLRDFGRFAVTHKLARRMEHVTVTFNNSSLSRRHLEFIAAVTAYLGISPENLAKRMLREGFVPLPDAEMAALHVTQN